MAASRKGCAAPLGMRVAHSICPCPTRCGHCCALVIRMEFASAAQRPASTTSTTGVRRRFDQRCAVAASRASCSLSEPSLITQLAGASVIGTWNLDIESERGARKQRLRVNSDMSALYGSTLIKKVNLDGDKLSFKYVMTFNDQDYETSFEGKVADSKLTGEVKTSRGTSKVTGAKRASRRPGSSQR